MKTTNLSGVLCCLALTAMCTSATAQERQGLSRLNPFARHAASARAEITDQSHTGFSLPKFSPPKIDLRPKWPASLTRKPGAPSAMSRLTAATKNLWAGTKRVLMPWRKTQASSPPLTGSRGFYPGSPNERMASKGSFFSPHRSRSTPQKDKVETVNDFLALPKPTF